MAEKPLECGYTTVTLPTEQPCVSPSDRYKGNIEAEKVNTKECQELGDRLKQIKGANK